MGRIVKLVYAFTALLLALAPVLEACTSIGVKTTDGYVFYARTMEGEVSFGSNVCIIPKGTAYQGTLPDGSQKGLTWTVKYGIVGMNTFGLPVISDGMNEAGLAAGNLLFPDFAQYQVFDPAKASKTITQYEVITWILSNFATVDEVKQAINNIRICTGPQAKTGVLELHYAVHDATGGSIVIEHVNGELKVYDNPLGVMTNSPSFDWHLINLRNYVHVSATNAAPFTIAGLKESGLGQGTGMLGLPGDYTPPSRFVRMVALVHSALPVTGPDEGLNLAMTIIDNVDIPIGAVRDASGKEVIYDRTQWVVISDLGRKRFYFRTYENKDWRMVDVTAALTSAKGIMTIQADTPPQYQDVTSKAKDYGAIPLNYFPASKP
ncbi:MAG: choloylglycine hydrolase family protein [Candidatus Omnitrophica bacterium]|nr:choloylglycine hydrolase family protein [Candidatus Omnitrophota bacterium]